MGIEQFKARLMHAQHVMRYLAGHVNGEERIGELKDKAEELEETINWSPKCKKPGIGLVGEATLRMSRGGKP